MEQEQEEEEGSLESLLKWAAEIGISDSPSSNRPLSSSSSSSSSCLGQSLSVSQFPDSGGRGLAAVRDLRKGELILRVPKSALITTQILLKDHPPLSLSINKHSSLSSTQILTVCLLYKMGKEKMQFHDCEKAEHRETERDMEEEEEEDGSLESLLKWAAEIGISDSPSSNRPLSSSSSSSCLGQSLSVSQFPDSGGRGLAAIRDLRKGKLILRVPKSALITTQILLKDQPLSLSINKHPSLSSTQILTVCFYPAVTIRYHVLVNLRHKLSKFVFQDYKFVLSLNIVNDAIWAAEKATVKAEFDWKEAISLMKELKLNHRLLTFRAWLWASASISSRTLHVPWDNAGCLCPVGDLFNYAAPGEEDFDSEDPFVSEDSSSRKNASSMQVNFSWNGDTTEQFDVEQIDPNLPRLTDGGYEDNVSAYCFYARRNYKKGEQVLLSYGTYTNLELLEHYGFLLDKNPNDKAFIPLEPEIYSSCSWPKDSLYIHPNGKPSFTLLSALRLWLTPPSQRRSVGHLVYSGSQLSAKNEIIVMGWIVKNCNVILNKFVTSIEEDKLLLRTIDKMQDFCTPTELERLLSAFEGEARVFAETKGLINGETGVNLLQSRQMRRYMDRWKLAVQWRLGYKKTLADCIAYCSKLIDPKWAIRVYLNILFVFSIKKEFKFFVEKKNFNLNIFFELKKINILNVSLKIINRKHDIYWLVFVFKKRYRCNNTKIYNLYYYLFIILVV
ncbi:hypothetical protein HYC85_005166 [Camellia sinensis]|uniref:SET domain-containing protein n=1 Tax=Camellia sinensis TaxID=4442 RepID=A0A7J7I089_CAMSI|nr:hypothetical protein HYC85_005166 [Camellia sinensis]